MAPAVATWARVRHTAVVYGGLVQGNPAAQGSPVGQVHPVGHVLVEWRGRFRARRFVDQHVEVEGHVVAQQLPDDVQGTFVGGAGVQAGNQLAGPHDLRDVLDAVTLLRLA
jgi:hypothetical protein